MRKICFCLFGLLFLVSSLMAQQTLRLKMPADLYYAKQPGPNKHVKFTIATKLPIINLIATGSDQSERLGANSINRRTNGKPGILIAIPKLYKVGGIGNEKVFSFGKEGGEKDNDDATVTIRHQNVVASPKIPSNQPPISFQVANAEIHTETRGSGHKDLKSTEHFLKVTATKNKTATISINRKSEQGNVIIAVFNSKNGNLLGTLNPKDPDNSAETLSLTIDTDAYIVPVIRPKVTTANGKDSIVFEVGDPRENGKVEAEEE